MGGKGYAAEFADFIVGEEGNQWLAKPSFTFHNVSAVQDSIKICRRLELVF
jgi:hypothetical protein